MGLYYGLMKWTLTSCPYHLSDAEAVPEVVEGDVVVVAVDLEQEVLQDLKLDVERRQEVQVGEHHLEEHQHLRLLPLPDGHSTHRCERSVCASESVFLCVCVLVLTSCQKWGFSDSLSLPLSPAASYGNTERTHVSQSLPAALFQQQQQTNINISLKVHQKTFISTETLRNKSMSHLMLRKFLRTCWRSSCTLS